RRRHTRFSRDWSSDVCSSDLAGKSKVLIQQTAVQRDFRQDRGDFFPGPAPVGTGLSVGLASFHCSLSGLLLFHHGLPGLFLCQQSLDRFFDTLFAATVLQINDVSRAQPPFLPVTQVDYG